MANEDVKAGSNTPNDSEHHEHVSNSFNEWRGSVADRIQPHEEEHVKGLQEAVIIRDSERVRHHLEQTKESSGWLYEELMKHPKIAGFIRELAIFGL